jgi:hypothetical protein
MDQSRKEEQISRIQKQETALNRVCKAVESADQIFDLLEQLETDIKMLEEYYRSEWMEDFEDDRAGRLPLDLPRGILSEDAIYDMLTDVQRMQQQILYLAKKIQKEHPDLKPHRP